jgi:hypothetical protein
LLTDTNRLNTADANEKLTLCFALSLNHTLRS